MNNMTKEEFNHNVMIRPIKTQIKIINEINMYYGMYYDTDVVQDIKDVDYYLDCKGYYENIKKDGFISDDVVCFTYNPNIADKFYLNKDEARLAIQELLNQSEFYTYPFDDIWKF